VYSYVFDPARSNWFGTSSAHGVTISDLSSADGVVAWSVKNAGLGTAHYRVYDPARGGWVSESGPGPVVQNRILNTNGVVAWSVATGVPHTTVYSRVYDPTRGGWRPASTGITAATSDLKTLDGVVAWSSSIDFTATIRFQVYDPGRGDWRAGSATAASVTSLRIENSQVSWNAPIGQILRGYNHGSGNWEATPSPLAYFAVSTNSGNAPFVVSFIDMSIGANSWSWTFGDGSGTSTRRSPAYRYTTFGRFTATQNAGGSVATRTLLTDTILPTGTISINGGATFTTNPVVTLNPTASDNSGVVTDMRFSNSNNANWSAWEALAPGRAWTLAAGNGIKTVFAQFRDIAMNTSATVSATIALDTTAPPVVSFGNVAVSETIGQATVQVTLDHPLGRNVSVRYSTSDGTATAPADYASSGGLLVFPSNTTSLTFNVPIVADSVVEQNETILLNFSEPMDCIPGPQGVITILDNDVASVAFASANYSVVESNGVATILVRLNAASGLPVTVDYHATNGTATVESDFTPTNGTLFFAPGETEGAFQVSIVSDTLDEFSETILLSLSNPTNAMLAAPGSATLTILDDDLPLLYFSKSSYPVFESAGAVMIEVQLSKPFPQEVAFNYTVFGGTATPGVSGDYLASNGRLGIAPNTPCGRAAAPSPRTPASRACRWRPG
jgi:PKD repeat protein